MLSDLVCRCMKPRLCTALIALIRVCRVLSLTGGLSAPRVADMHSVPHAKSFRSTTAMAAWPSISTLATKLATHHACWARKLSVLIFRCMKLSLRTTTIGYLRASYLSQQGRRSPSAFPALMSGDSVLAPHVLAGRWPVETAVERLTMWCDTLVLVPR